MASRTARLSTMLNYLMELGVQITEAMKVFPHFFFPRRGEEDSKEN